MSIIIRTCDLAVIKARMLKHVYSLNSYLDSFLEEHILKSTHYEILHDTEQVGYFSIYKRSLLTQFYLDPEFRALAQEIFNQVKRYENLEKAFVFTGDEFFLTHALDYSRHIDYQAYFFADSQAKINDDQVLHDMSCRLALEEDLALIETHSGDFFENPINHVQKQEIYIGYLHEEIVSFGIIEKSQIYENIASIGMYTVPAKRQSGIGRNTLLCLKEICYNTGYTPIAGCWYYNHNSKKTLESAGMIAQSRLLVIKLV